MSKPMKINIEMSHVVLLDIVNKELISTQSSLDMTEWLLSSSNTKETERIALNNKRNFYEFRIETLKELKQQILEVTA